MRRKLIFAASVLALLFTALWAVSSESKAEVSQEALTFDKLFAIDKDSAFLASYSEKLGVQLDSNCNADFIAAVTDWLGTPYRHAGQSTGGSDCSGFVSAIYKDVFGIELVHSSVGMFFQMKEIVKKKELKEGDVLFFRIHGRRISHVGIYLRNNKFIHASTYRGIVVDDLTEPYYQRTFYAGGRPYHSEAL